MRTYGRTSTGQWVEITDTDYVWLATLAQTLRLQQGESPFYANYGIPAIQSVISQIAPDAAVARTQMQFAKYFASLSVTRILAAKNPTYNIRAVFPNGGSPISQIIAT
jgi:hypothetical protein